MLWCKQVYSKGKGCIKMLVCLGSNSCYGLMSIAYYFTAFNLQTPGCYNF